MIVTVRPTLLAICFLSSQVQAQSVPSQRGLEGFQLGQYLRTAQSMYASPRLERVTEDKWAVKAYRLPGEQEVNVIFQCPPPEPYRIFSIQVTGNPASAHALFAGLKLGMGERAVAAILGKPTGRMPYKDGKDSYVRLDYAGRNYSLEFDDQDRLVSLMLWGYDGFPEMPKELPKIADLKAALASKDPAQLAEAFAPDAEIYRNEDVVKLERSSLLEFTDSQDWHEALFGSSGLEAALARKDAAEDFQIRMAEGEDQQMQMFSVCKFPDSAVLKEIVFRPHAGRWRVYEVAFRNSTGK